MKPHIKALSNRGEYVRDSKESSITRFPRLPINPFRDRIRTVQTDVACLETAGISFSKAVFSVLSNIVLVIPFPVIQFSIWFCCVAFGEFLRDVLDNFIAQSQKHSVAEIPAWSLAFSTSEF